MSHTPGPWVVEENDGVHEIRMGSALESRASWAVQHRIEYEHGLWADEESTPTERAQYEEACANARLIAAAPDLLDAVRNLLAASSPASRRLARTWAEAAMTKAIGEDES